MRFGLLARRFKSTATQRQPNARCALSNKERAVPTGLKYPRHILIAFGCGLAIIAIGVLLAIVSLLVRGEGVVYGSLLAFIAGALLVYGSLEAADGQAGE